MLHKIWKKKVEKSRTTLQFDQVILKVVQSTKKFQEKFNIGNPKNKTKEHYIWNIPNKLW